MECCERIIVLLLLSLAVVRVRSIYAESDDGVISILCVDSVGEPLANATVTISKEGMVVYMGFTNSSGFLPEAIPRNTYHVEVKWRGRPVYSSIPPTKYDDILKIPCEVYTLSIRVNYLDVIPIVNARITISDIEERRIIYSVDRLKVPYGFFVFSAETSIKLPKGEYEIIVESLNSEKKNVFLVDNLTLKYTNVLSLDSILFIILLISTIISFILFILVGRR
ncbi:MAG: hypothetical protein RMJ00_00620 [Nitrososphaerota archaeon]|nr:carboxypeptidase-like regulatory domain-containing protein [Candidatus Bathyarchaeota archaeon]MDW8061193.1 hypothetical protein [Nitrososphaerota archaeon]